MGHRKYNAPRRGSLAYRPRGRAASPVPWFRNWPKVEADRPVLLGHAGFKAGSLHVITVDDREKTPNYGKPLFNHATIIATPPILVCGFRAYVKTQTGLQSLIDAYIKDLPKETARKITINPKPVEEAVKKIEANLDRIARFSIHAYVSPRDAHLLQKTPIIFEVGVGGGDKKTQLEYIISTLGKKVPVSDFVKPGMYLDVAGVSKGKGFEGPITRFGVKTKQAKSRKSVRAVAVIGPWHPAAVKYTVPRAGQMGFHHRTEFNKKVLAVGSAKEQPVTPKGGFDHYGIVDGDYIVLRGSVPGPAKRPIRLRMPIRKASVKIQTPKILEVSTVGALT
ncbi:MAG: 50S ribosomal protein L3 [Thaumarchaeota archaeon]|nr:50S ribosomal protein L3 [Nitrososphaerota archaeon]